MSRYKKQWYNSYRSMMSRCYNEKSANYKYYGGKGVGVCDEWHDFDNFDKWASMTFIAGCTLDRINNDKDYSPSNCRWATKSEQANNKTNTYHLTFNGETHTITEWAKITGINRSTLNNRFNRGWSVEDMLTCPVTHGNQYTFRNAVERGEKHEWSLH